MSDVYKYRTVCLFWTKDSLPSEVMVWKTREDALDYLRSWYKCDKCGDKCSCELLVDPLENRTSTLHDYFIFETVEIKEKCKHTNLNPLQIGIFVSYHKCDDCGITIRT